MEWIRNALLVLNVQDESIIEVLSRTLHELQGNMETVAAPQRDRIYYIVQHGSTLSK
jgi:hypothetical protein